MFHQPGICGIIRKQIMETLMRLCQLMRVINLHGKLKVSFEGMRLSALRSFFVDGPERVTDCEEQNGDGIRKCHEEKNNLHIGLI